jgi:hypothetical protein
MLKLLAIIGAGLALALVVTDASAQQRCEPTLANPCKPQPSTGAPATPQRREPSRLNESAIPDIQVDRNTTIGIGQGGGIFGLERKYDPKEQPWR